MTRRTTLYSRQVQAVEDLWGAINALSFAKGISATIAILNFEEAAKEAAINPRFREMFEMMGKFDNNQAYKEATKSRPFVSEMAWAYYSAYQTIITHGLLRLKALQIGVDQDYADHKTILSIVKVALPEYEDFIAKHGVRCLHYLLDTLETKLLKEIQVILKDRVSDEEDIQRAAQILEETEKLIINNVKIQQA